MNDLLYNIHIMSSYVLGTDYQYYTVAEQYCNNHFVNLGVISVSSGS